MVRNAPDQMNQRGNHRDGDDAVCGKGKDASDVIISAASGDHQRNH